MDISERVEKYVEKMDASVSGSGGHDVAFKVACVLVNGFDLSDGEAASIMRGRWNSRCSPPWSQKEIEHKVRSARGVSHQGSAGHLLGSRGGVSGVGGACGFGKSGAASYDGAKTASVVSKRQEVDEVVRRRFLKGGGFTQMVDLMERSPVDVRKVGSAEGFLSCLYPVGERVLIFTSQRSQGDFGHFSSGDGGSPGKTYRLGARPGVKAELAECPSRGREGVWFLAQPVNGEWLPNGGKTTSGKPKLSRRSGRNVTDWRYLLIEADDVVPDEWLATVSQLPLAIAAVYTSGGRSLHALVRVDCRTHAEFNKFAQKIGPLVAKLGGDSAAISGVRLTRLPFCFREGKRKRDGVYVRCGEPVLQRLLYLNPEPSVKALVTMPKIRRYDAPK